MPAKSDAALERKREYQRAYDAARRARLRAVLSESDLAFMAEHDKSNAVVKALPPMGNDPAMPPTWIEMESRYT